MLVKPGFEASTGTEARAPERNQVAWAPPCLTANLMLCFSYAR